MPFIISHFIFVCHLWDVFLNCAKTRKNCYSCWYSSETYRVPSQQIKDCWLPGIPWAQQSNNAPQILICNAFQATKFEIVSKKGARNSFNPFWSTFRENFPQGTQHFYHDIKHQNTPIKWIIIVRLSSSSSWNGWISQHIKGSSTRWGNIIPM